MTEQETAVTPEQIVAHLRRFVHEAKVLRAFLMQLGTMQTPWDAFLCVETLKATAHLDIAVATALGTILQMPREAIK